MSYQVVQNMKEEFKSQIDQEYTTLEEIKDNSGEWVDGYLPVYNSDIIKAWSEMPSEYDDRGALELGHMGETTIIGLMSLDLYIYYTDLFNEAIQELEDEAEEVNA